MKFSAILLTGLTLITASVSASPAPAPAAVAVAGPDTNIDPASHPGGVLEARACPTIATIESWLASNTKIGDKTVFYSGKAGNRDAMNFANSIGGQYYGSLFTQAQFFAWMDLCGTTDTTAQDQLVPNMCAAMAAKSTGTAYVMLYRGDTIKANSVWMTTEYPALVKNKVKVIAVNVENHKDQEAWTPETKF